MSQKNDKQAALKANQLKLLQKSNKRLSAIPLAQWLQRDGRFAEFSRSLPGVLFDFSRVGIDGQALEELLELAQICRVEQHRDRLFAADRVNVSEDRPALHMALRNRDLLRNIDPRESILVTESMQAMFTLADKIGKGQADHPLGGITDIVHIGIGGSLLGTRLLNEALTPPGADLKVHFLGSVDGHEREQLLPRLQAASTLVVMVSKSFTTVDTLLHGTRVHQWLREELGDQAAKQHLFAVTGAVGKAREFGVASDQILYLPDWIGGRFSLWSAVSLSVAVQMGSARFKDLLAGARAMDEHFCSADLPNNLPVLMALIAVWHRNICAYGARGVMPYDQRLRSLPAYLQQLFMESNGKSVGMDGKPVSLATAPVIFGETGTDAQHSLFQAMHQGSDVLPLSFVGVIKPDHGDCEAHNELLSNMLAQLTALAEGRDSPKTRQQWPDAEPGQLAQRVFTGSRPSDLLLLDRLDAFNLGQLLALYEHQTFVESVLWGINAFDQWGVELGKTLTPSIHAALASENGEAESSPASLAPVLKYIRGIRN